MAEHRTQDQQGGRSAARRRERVERIVAAAGELMGSLGYQRVSMGDVAQRAGIGKGTVYLHFPSKEDLFLTVLLSTQARLADGLVAMVRDDARNVLPSRLAAEFHTRITADPLIHAVVFGDTATLGTLVRYAVQEVGGLMGERQAALREHFTALHRRGLIRSSSGTPDDVLTSFSAVLTGFLVYPGINPAGPVPEAGVARLLEATVRDAFETPDPAPDALRAVADAVVPAYAHVIDLLHTEIDRRLLS
ncbi:TetR/AcrR family transcriptional regulator [Nocardiopsis coralliicola]